MNVISCFQLYCYPTTNKIPSFLAVTNCILQINTKRNTMLPNTLFHMRLSFAQNIKIYSSYFKRALSNSLPSPTQPDPPTQKLSHLPPPTTKECFTLLQLPTKIFHQSPTSKIMSHSPICSPTQNSLSTKS